jgi:hypothetical protein
MGIVIVLAFAFLVILIPQFLRARTVARRTQCLNNLKNVALALQNYSEVHECYPPGYIVRGVEAHDSALVEHGPGWGWGVMVLPHLDQQPMYSMFDFSRDLAGGATMIQTYLCPDGAGAVFTVPSSDAGMITLAPANFVGVAGRGSLTEEPGRPAFPGMLYRNSSVRQDDVPDGISNTLLLGERRSVWDGPQGGLIDTSSTWLGAPSGAFRDPGYLDEPRLEGPGSLVLGVVGQTRPISLKLSPNCAPAGIGFTSGHEDRVHFARVDGSCSTISPQIDAEVFVRLGQRSDGEPTGER